MEINIEGGQCLGVIRESSSVWREQGGSIVEGQEEECVGVILPRWGGLIRRCLIIPTMSFRSW